ncbi:hypothetical protein VKT23_006097 [Stygiomarasmius scandens]|uniref:DUF6533 domain-containing protein n=1 Tax=Marasmiellus scandens TaxID=2682957 RepID=A0ABR1JS40_9AGAR
MMVEWNSGPQTRMLSIEFALETDISIRDVGLHSGFIRELYRLPSRLCGSDVHQALKIKRNHSIYTLLLPRFCATKLPNRPKPQFPWVRPNKDILRVLTAANMDAVELYERFQQDHTFVNNTEFNNGTAEFAHWYTTNYVGLAGYTALIWDHLITLPLEIEYIWKPILKGERKPLLILFLINRYLIPLGFILNLFAYLSPALSRDPTKHCIELDVQSCKCHRFIRYEGAVTMVGIDIVGLMMFLRIFALYHGKKLVIYAVAALLALMIAMNAWMMAYGTGVPHTYVQACTMIFAVKSNLRWAASSTAWLPLVYDTVVMCLTFYKTFPELRKDKDTMYLMRRLLEDGLLYYSVILAVAGGLTIMIIIAPDGLKNVCAQ